jgi:uncharacterized protein YbjT (DUF2867 family)
VRWLFSAMARSLIHEQDIAAVAILALAEGGHTGARYVLTWPQVLTQVEQVIIIGQAIGRPVRWEEIPPEAARQEVIAGWGDQAHGWRMLQRLQAPRLGTRAGQGALGAEIPRAARKPPARERRVKEHDL